MVLRVRPWPRRLLRSVKLFPSPPRPSPAAHGGVQGGGGGTGFFFKIRQVLDNLQEAAPCRAGGQAGGGGRARQDVGGTPSVSRVRGDAGPRLRVGVSRGSPEPCAWGRWCHSRPRRRGPVARGRVAMPGPTARARGVSLKSLPHSQHGCSGETSVDTPPPPAPGPLWLCLCSVLIDR